MPPVDALILKAMQLVQNVDAPAAAAALREAIDVADRATES